MSEVITTLDFWDCECPENYIHSKALEPVCPLCECIHEEQSDSRVNEVEALIASVKDTPRDQLHPHTQLVVDALRYEIAGRFYWKPVKPDIYGTPQDWSKVRSVPPAEMKKRMTNLDIARAAAIVLCDTDVQQACADRDRIMAENRPVEMKP